jgi:hypothetical protein
MTLEIAHERVAGPTVKPTLFELNGKIREVLARFHKSSVFLVRVLEEENQVPIGVNRTWVKYIQVCLFLNILTGRACYSLWVACPSDKFLSTTVLLSRAQSEKISRIRMVPICL